MLWLGCGRGEHTTVRAPVTGWILLAEPSWLNPDVDSPWLLSGCLQDLGVPCRPCSGPGAPDQAMLQASQGSLKSGITHWSMSPPQGAEAV